MRLDIIEFRRERVRRPVKIDVEEATEVPVKVAVKDAAGNVVIEERLEPRMVKKTIDRVIEEDRDYVEYAAPGRRLYATTVKAMPEILAIQDPPFGEDDEDKLAEAQKRDYILPRYEAWKQGQTVPTHGYPISAWGAVNAKTRDLFAMHGVHVVEEIAELTEQARSRMGNIGNLPDLIKLAKTFIGSADRREAAANMKALEDQNVALKDQLAEQEAMLKEMQAMLIEMKQQAPAASAKPKRAQAEAAA